MLRGFSLVLALVAAVLGYIVYNVHKVPELPELDYDKWWGDGDKPKQEDNTIRPFKIEFNDTMVEDLKSRLRSRRPFTRPMDGIQSEYGINTIYLDKVLNYWHDKYNFKERAARLNKFSHFKTKIQGMDLHFIRARSEGKKNVLPILLMHGWPSSSKEFDMVIPILLENRKEYDFGFEIIAVDLPGYGFSEGTNKPGLNPLQIAVVMRNLMRRLGFNKYYIHAGDWGSQAGTFMATLFQDEVLGYHTNMPLSSRPLSILKHVFGSLLFPSLLVEERFINRISPLKNVVSYLMKESGYFHLHATKPDTIGAALTDTPVGMAAYLLEKIGVCSNRDQTNTPHGGLENIHIDDLLDTVTIMWGTGSITTSTRLYAEAFDKPEIFIAHEIPTQVPTAVVNFRYEVVFQPDWILRDKFHNLVRSTTLDFGGHFIALEKPKELAEDILISVSEFVKLNKSKCK